MIIGSEKSEDYARASLPTNRWELFWDIFKGSFKKLMLVNLLMLLFFIPLLLLIFFYSNAKFNFGIMCPYSQGFGVGYQATNSFVGIPETISTQLSIMMFALLPVACLIASIGLAGGAYVMRNMVWSEGIFIANDFWKGVKQNFKELLLIALFYSIILYSSIVAISFANQAMALQTAPTWLMLVCKIGSIVLLCFFTIATMHMITMSVTYKLSFFKLLRNSFIFTIGLLPQNVFFGVCALAPYILLNVSGIIMIIAAVITLFFGIAYSLLVWTTYSHWIYDKFLNDRIEGAQKNRGIYEKSSEGDPNSLARYGAQQTKPVKCALNSRPIKPITDEELTVAELPTSFNRADIERLNASKQALIEDNERYIEEHKDEEQYKVEEEPKVETPEEKKKAKRIEKAKKELEKRKKK